MHADAEVMYDACGTYHKYGNFDHPATFVLAHANTPPPPPPSSYIHIPLTLCQASGRASTKVPLFLSHRYDNDYIQRRNSRFLQSPHCAANCLHHVRSSGPGAIVCKSRATHRALITCNMSCYVPRGTKGQLSY